MLRADPKRWKDRRAIADPNWTKSRTLKLLPILPIP
jgi:hypothetical protein